MGQIISSIRNYFRPGSATTSTITIDLQNRRRLSSKGELEPAKVYSWTNRGNVNYEDFKYVGLEGKTLYKPPGSINGQQFIIERCRNCTILLLDWSDSVTVLDCTGCAILIGPCKGSFFLRHCVDCTVLVICQQFRTRDCRRISAYVSCTTQPIIENTIGAKFACLQMNYPKLKEQFQCAGLSPFNNDWSNIHDYTPNVGEAVALTGANFFVVREPLATAQVGMCDPETIGDLAIEIDFNPSESLVPFTHGVGSETEETSLVIFFNDGSQDSGTLGVLRIVRKDFPSIILVKTKEIRISSTDARRLLSTDAYSAAASKGPATVFYCTGPDAEAQLRKIIANSTLPPASVYVSASSDVARAQIETLWNLAEMEMN